MLRGHTYSDGQALEQECQMMAFCLPESRVAHHKKNASNMTCQTSAIWGTPYQITWCSEWAVMRKEKKRKKKSQLSVMRCQLSVMRCNDGICRIKQRGFWNQVTHSRSVASSIDLRPCDFKPDVHNQPASCLGMIPAQEAQRAHPPHRVHAL
eukprot:1159397-Pelagomonas_calceolata.AAC.3